MKWLIKLKQLIWTVNSDLNKQLKKNSEKKKKKSEKR